MFFIYIITKVLGVRCGILTFEFVTNNDRQKYFRRLLLVYVNRNLTDIEIVSRSLLSLQKYILHGQGTYFTHIK